MASLDESAGDPATPPVPSRPHMPPRVAALLEARMKEARCFLEYGSGGSTVLATSLGIPRIVSVENNRSFARAVRDAANKVGSKTTLHMITVDLGRTGQWGVPSTFDFFEKWPNYAIAPWDFMRENKKFWLVPILTVLVLTGLLLVMTQGSAVAPFIYTLF